MQQAIAALVYRLQPDMIHRLDMQYEPQPRYAQLAPPALLATLERQHTKNAHKYAVGAPAVHLDVMPRGVPGGERWSASGPR